MSRKRYFHENLTAISPRASSYSLGSTIYKVAIMKILNTRINIEKEKCLPEAMEAFRI